MDILIWMLIAFAGAAGLWFFAIRPALRKPAPRPGSEERPPCTETCEVFDREGAVVRHACGHDSHLTFKFRFWGETVASFACKVPKRLCADCLMAELLKRSVRCGQCGYAILPGDGIALYSDKQRFDERWKTVIDGQVIGCLRMDCCPSGGFYAGHWTFDGFKPEFPGGRTAAAQVFATGEALIVGDTDAPMRRKP